MKYCTHCGNQLLDEAVICPKCGFPTENAATAPVPVTAMSIAPSASVTPPPAPVKPKKLTYSPLSIVGFVFAFIVPLVGLICSILAYKNAGYDENKRCKSFSKAGIIIAVVFFVVHLGCQIADYVLRAKGIGSFEYWKLWWDLFF